MRAYNIADRSTDRFGRFMRKAPFMFNVNPPQLFDVDFGAEDQSGRCGSGCKFYECGGGGGGGSSGSGGGGGGSSSGSDSGGSSSGGGDSCDSSGGNNSIRGGSDSGGSSGGGGDSCGGSGGGSSVDSDISSGSGGGISSGSSGGSSGGGSRSSSSSRSGKSYWIPVGSISVLFSKYTFSSYIVCVQMISLSPRPIQKAAHTFFLRLMDLPIWGRANLTDFPEINSFQRSQFCCLGRLGRHPPLRVGMFHTTL